MILQVIAILTVASVVAEFMILKRVPWLLRLNRKHPALGFALSIGISWVLGMMFGMAGMIVGVAGILSSVISEPIHAFNRKAEQKQSGWAADFKVTYRPVMQLIKHVLMLPLYILAIPVALHRWYRDNIAVPA